MTTLSTHPAAPPVDTSLATPTKHIITCVPLFVDVGATVQQAAQLMRDTGASSTLVRGDSLSTTGIVTDRDLRGRVLAEGRGPETPVRDVMSSPLVTLDSDSPVYAALLTMLEAGINHLALVEEGNIVGMVSSTDLLRHQGRSPLALVQRVRRMGDSQELADYAHQIRHTVEALHQGGVGAAQIGQMVSSLNDALVSRLLKLAEADFGPPPTSYAWIVFGSEGRLEQTLLTDQDNALVYGDASEASAEETEQYFSNLAQRTVDGLMQAGFPPCPGGYMATNWCKPLAAWQKIFRGWIHEPEPQALMEASIFFDFRKAHGELSLEPLHEIIAGAQSEGLFIGHMVRAAQAFSPPLTLFRRIRTKEGSEVNLKQGGLAPIVGLARATTLAAGSRERSTLERLVASREASTLSSDGANNLAEAFQFLLRLRLDQQLAALAEDRQPSNSIDIDELAPLERSHLRRALLTVRQMQEGVGAALAPGMVT